MKSLKKVTTAVCAMAAAAFIFIFCPVSAGADSEQPAGAVKGYPVYLRSDLSPVENVARFEYGENYTLPGADTMHADGSSFLGWAVCPPENGNDYVFKADEDYSDFLKYSCVKEITVCGECSLFAVWQQSADGAAAGAGNQPVHVGEDEVALCMKLTGVECNKESQTSVKRGGRLWVNLSPKKGCQMTYLDVVIGEDIFVIDVDTGTFDVAPDDSQFSYNPSTHNLLIPEHYTYGDITITAVAVQPFSNTSLVRTELPADGSLVSSNDSNHVDENGNYETIITATGDAEIRNLSVTLGNGNLPFEIDTKTGEITGTGPVKTTENIKYDVETGALTLSDIKSDVAISVSSRKDMYKVSVKTNSGGKVSGSAENFVPDGGSIKFNVNPDTGNEVYDIIVDGQSRGAGNRFSLENLDADHSVTVLFAKTAPDETGTPAYWWRQLIISAIAVVVLDTIRKNNRLSKKN